MTPPPPPTNSDPNLWFSDAPLIFVATRKPSCVHDTPNVACSGKEILFRVHGTTLAIHSSVFRDMMNMPQPPDPDILYGCTVVRLQDSAQDVAKFFKAIFDTSFFKPPPARTEFLDVVAVLKLSHKYDVPHLRRCALLHLATAYPTSLRDWDRRSTAGTFSPPTRLDDELELLQLVTLHDVRWVMPMLYYSCSTRSVFEIIESKATSLDQIDQRRIRLAGYLKQYSSTTRALRFLILPSSDGCTTRDACNIKALSWFEQAETWRPSIPLNIWDDSDWKKLGNDICTACLTRAKAAHRKARHTIWDDIPGMYGLPSWQELEMLKLRDLE